MVSFIIGAIGIGAIFLYGCVGEIITEKSGHLNLGIPGIMCMGTAGGCLGVDLYMRTVAITETAQWFPLVALAILFSILFATLAGLIYAFLTVTLRSNQNITGLALTTFGSGFAQFFMTEFVDMANFARASLVVKKNFGFLKNLGAIGEILSSYGILFYVAIIIAIIAAVILKRTKVGLNLRAVGENPATADATGVNVTAYKYVAILVGSAVAGLGGLFYVMDYNMGTFDNTSTIQAFGWLAIALVIFCLWKPDLAILGSIVFGALYIAPFKISGISFSQTILFKLLPYVITVIVLIVTSIMNKKENQPPASLGLNYFREER